MAASKGPRYAPEDPSLPKPWRALVDGNTGYLYFWNPETNVTQYQKPDPLPLPISAPKSHAAAAAFDSESESESKPIPKSSPVEDEEDRHHTHIQNEEKEKDSRTPHQISMELAREHGLSDIGSRSSAEAYRRQHEITVTEDVPHPFTTFESTGFPPEILREVLRAGFSAPTPIQAQSWPIALKNHDIVAVAKTGSGKTLGYLIPGFIHIKRLQNDSKIGPRVLVLSPTRELATQIHDEAAKFGRSSRISSVCLYGGAPKGPQLRDLDRGADVVIATPGRLNDILEMRRVNLHQVSYMVLDEADRMLDMGFEPQIRKIVNQIPLSRQTLMFTATWPKEVRKIAADLLVKPVQVNIGNIDQLVANKSITQYVEVIRRMEKQRRLEQILRSQEPGSKIIIFCATKRMCDQLARTLTHQFGAAAIHGDKSQGERDSILAQFRSGSSPVLVATDVAARGLDIKDIRVVINYDFPTGIEDYVHRIGRTGRAGATGVAHTFFCDQDSKYASDLVKILEGANQRVPSELRDMVSSHVGYGGKSHRWSSGSGTAHDDYDDGSRYDGGDGNSVPPYLGQQDASHVRTGYGDYKSSCARFEDEGPVWSHDKMIGAAAAGGGGTSFMGCMRRSEDDGPVWSHDKMMGAAAAGGEGTSFMGCMHRSEDDGPVWSHDKMMGAAAAGGGGTSFSSRTNSGQSGMWGSSSDNKSRSRSPEC